MAATIKQKPDSLSLLRNMKSFILGCDQDVAFSLKKGSEILIDESYSPDNSGNVEIDVRDVIAQCLRINLPTSNAYKQSEGVASFTAYADDAQIAQFTVVKAGVGRFSGSASSFLSANWLTRQPAVKQVAWAAPEYLTGYFSSSSSVTAKFYLKDGTEKTVTVASVGAGLFSINVAFSRLVSLSGLSTDAIYGVIDVSAGSKYTQRFVCVPTQGDEHYYLAANSLGGVDTWTFHGACTAAPDIKHEVAEKTDAKHNVTKDIEMQWQQTTGYMPQLTALWFWEFIAADRQWAVMNGNAERIVLRGSSADISDESNLNSCSFKFALAVDGDLISIQRSSEPMVTLEVPSPSGEIFFLKARLLDYEDAELTDDILFLVQTPYSQKWKKTSLGNLASWLDDHLSETSAFQSSHWHDNKEVLDKFGEDSSGLPTYDGKSLQTKGDSDGRYLRKDIDDAAEGKITFKKGADFGDFSSGLQGKGASIDEYGHGEFDSLSIRRFLEVPELRYNRISVQIGNRWRAPGGGIIESVEIDKDATGAELMTGTITLHLEDGEPGMVAIDDICQGIYHDGMTLSNNATDDFDDYRGNFRFAGFFTSYFRITEILASDGSKFRYELRPVSDRWPYHLHPCRAMHFVAYGNFTDTSRQSSRYSTLTYERYLRNVNDWEFTSSMIVAQFGDVTNLSVLGISMEGYSAYLDNIYMRGTIQQFVDAPLRVAINTDGDQFLAKGESLHLTCSLWRGYLEDITSQVKSWSITRKSDDATNDSSWALKDKAKNFAGEIDICFTDEENDLGGGLSTTFTVTASLESGAQAEAEIVI